MAKSDVLVRMKADTQGYDANIAKARRQLDQFKKDNLSMGGVIKQLNGNLLATAARFASVTAAVGALGAAFRSNIETARGFEKSMSQLSSLTGMVGDDLNKLKEYSIELGASTTLSASQVADAFKMIGSQQPQLLASGEALKAVTKNAITLAEAAGIELSDAAKTLSVSINQMGGDSGNAERYINVLAAASQKGAGDIVWLGEAITKSGTTAKAVGTDYEELVANLEQLAKAGYDASTAGTALRSIIMNLEKQANNDYKPSVVGLTQAFENLGNANLTLTEYQGISGKMFAAQAKALADAAGEAKNMKEEITGTNIAEEQAKTNTDNLDGSLKSLASAWEGLNLHMNSSNGILRDAVDWLKEVVIWADQAYQSLEKWYNGQNKESIITSGLNDVTDTVDDNGRLIRKDAIANIPEVVVSGSRKGGGGITGKGSKGGKGGSSSIKTEEQLNNEQIQKLTQEYIKASNERQAAIRAEIKELQDRNAVIQQLKDEALGKNQTGDIQASFDKLLMKTIAESVSMKPLEATGPSDAWRAYTESQKKNTDELKSLTDALGALNESEGISKNGTGEKGVEKTDKDSALENTTKVVNGLSAVASGLQSMGVKLPDGVQKILGIAQGIISVIQGVNTVISVFSSTSQAANTTAILANTAAQSGAVFAMGTLTAAVAANTAALATNTAVSIIPFARGGIVPHAANGFVPGNDHTDSTEVMVSSGELILNKAQQGNLASQLGEGGLGGVNLSAVVTGEQIHLVHNRYLRRIGEGEILTWK